MKDFYLLAAGAGLLTGLAIPASALSQLSSIQPENYGMQICGVFQDRVPKLQSNYEGIRRVDGALHESGSAGLPSVSVASSVSNSRCSSSSVGRWSW